MNESNGSNEIPDNNCRLSKGYIENFTTKHCKFEEGKFNAFVFDLQVLKKTILDINYEINKLKESLSSLHDEVYSIRRGISEFNVIAGDDES